MLGVFTKTIVTKENDSVDQLTRFLKLQVKSRVVAADRRPSRGRKREAARQSPRTHAVNSSYIFNDIKREKFIRYRVEKKFNKRKKDEYIGQVMENIITDVNHRERQTWIDSKKNHIFVFASSFFLVRIACNFFKGKEKEWRRKPADVILATPFPWFLVTLE